MGLKNFNLSFSSLRVLYFIVAENKIDWLFMSKQSVKDEHVGISIQLFDLGG